MLEQVETDEQRARAAAVEAQRVPWREIGRWYAPWALAVVLVLVFLGALWTASASTDEGGYAVGVIGAVLALGALLWELNTALNGRSLVLSSRVVVDDEVSLLVLIVLLVIMALGGLVLAADGTSVVDGGVGYGLALFGIVFIFVNLKHYFDVREPHS
jgi:hypothetical protein